MRLAWHPYLEPQLVQSDLTRPTIHDALGHKLHLAFAMLFCFLLAWPMTLVELAGIPLMIMFALRAPNIWRTWGSFAVQPLLLALALFVAWQALTLIWSPDVKHGLRELGTNRWIWAMWALWPVMMHRHLLIAALAAGFLCGNLSQAVHIIGVQGDIAWLTWDRMPDRNSGWWNPVAGGTILVAALGLHLPAAAMGRGRWRFVGIAGASITLLGIFATGTRGAWIAALALVGLVITVAIVRHTIMSRRQHGSTGMLRRVSPALLLGIVLLSAGAAGWLAIGDSVMRRLAEGRQEVALAVQDQDYQSYTGGRILMASWAFAAARQHPLGVGLGGYQPWTHQQLEAKGQQDLIIRVHRHAHNAPLHIAATTGWVGLALAMLVVYFALRGAFAGLSWDRLGSYAAGPGFAIVGLLLAGLFDVVHVTTQAAAILAALFGMSLVSRPPEVRATRGTEASTIGPDTHDNEPSEGPVAWPDAQKEMNHARNLPEVL